MSTERAMIYVFLDGDDVGARLESLLRRNQIFDAAVLSMRLREAVQALEHLVRGFGEAELIAWGGDDVMFRCPADVDPMPLVDESRRTFERMTQLTMSGGIGATPTGALDGLAAAKGTGKDRVIYA